jgi:hypothetical protein
MIMQCCCSRWWCAAARLSAPCSRRPSPTGRRVSGQSIAGSEALQRLPGPTARPAGGAWRKVTISYTREQQRLPPPKDPASPSGSWYNDEIVEAYSHLLRREQTKTRGVHNNDVIPDPRFTYFMIQLHEADPERDAESITRWTTKFVHPWREEIRKAKPNNIYIPYQANENHWMLLCMSTTHNTITIYDSLKYEIYKEAAKLMAKLVQEWWQTPMTIIWGSCAQQPSGNGYDCGPCVCLNMRRLMLKRRRPRALTSTRTSREEWGYSNDQA